MAGPLGNVGAEATNHQTAVSAALTMIQVVVGIISALVLVLAVLGAYFVGSSLTDIEMKTDAAIAAAKLEVEKIVASSQEEVRYIGELYRSTLEEKIDSALARAIESESASFSEALESTAADYQDALGRSQALLAAVKDTAIYKQVVDEQKAESLATWKVFKKRIDDGEFADGMSASERLDMAAALDGLISDGLKLEETAEEIYNAAARASDFDFSTRAHRLSSIAYWLDPALEYRVRVLRMELLRGDSLAIERNSDGSYEVQSLNWPRDADKADKIRRNAFQGLMESASEAPLQSYELVVSEAWNAALYTSQYNELIRILEEDLARRESTEVYFPSYGHIILAQLYASQGEIGWRDKFLRHIELAEQKVSNESPLSTWYSNTLIESSQLKSDVLGVAAEAADGEADVASMTESDIDAAIDIVERVISEERPLTGDEEKAVVSVLVFLEGNPDFVNAHADLVEKFAAALNALPDDSE